MTSSVIIQKIVFGATLVLIGLILIGFSGRSFGPGDTAAVVRPQAAVLLVPLAALLLWMKARFTALVSLILATLALGSIAPGFFVSRSDCSEGCLTLYQKNLLSKAWPRYPLADDIIKSGAKIVTLQEVSDHNRRFMANMFAHYPTAVICKFRPAQDVAVMTSLPVVEGSEFCLAEAGLAGVQLLAPNSQPIWVLSVHLEWPFPFDQYHQSQKIANRIADLEGPVLIAGDFNMVPWGASLHRIKKAVDNVRLGAFRNTYRLGGLLLPLPIDSVLVPNGVTGTVELRPYMGSDHIGVLSRIDLQ